MGIIEVAALVAAFFIAYRVLAPIIACLYLSNLFEVVLWLYLSLLFCEN